MRLKTNCVVTVSGLTSLQIDTKQSRVRNRLFQVKLSSWPRLVARRTTSRLNLNSHQSTEELLKITLKSPENMASVSPWSVAGGKIKRTFLTARLNCQRNGRRWDASCRSIRSSIKEYWNGLQSREAKVSFLSNNRNTITSIS